jgi:hypothetical protein
MEKYTHGPIVIDVASIMQALASSSLKTYPLASPNHKIYVNNNNNNNNIILSS